MTRTASLRHVLMGASALTAAIFVAAAPGQAAAQNIVIGGNAGDNQTRVIGSGETVSTSSVYVGGFGRGALTVQSGGRLQANYLVAGAYAQGVGIVNATGAGTQINVNGNIYIGDYSRGELTVSDGATVRSRDDMVLGRNANGVAIVQVNGAGSSLVSDTGLTVGAAGRAELSITNGGRVGVADSLFVASSAGSRGVITVSGADSSLTAGNILIGYAAYGELNVTNGATATSRDGIWIGHQAGATGVVTVSSANSSLTAGTQLEVGSNGQGTLTVSSGGVVSAQRWISLGYQSTGVGSGTVTGAGSTLTSADWLYVGAQGRGELTVSNGGSARAQGGMRVGVTSTGSGVVTVDGAGSTLMSTTNIHVGDAGNGQLIISAGGGVAAQGSVVIGSWAGSVGAVTVTGAGSQLVANQIVVGRAGRGELTVSNGGDVGYMNIAVDAGSTGVVYVGGRSGSAVAAAGTLNGVGFGAGDGHLVFNHNTANYAYTGGIAGTTAGQGRISFEAGRTRFNTIDHGFTGVSDIFSGASLYLNGALGGTLNVLAGGELGGVGTVGVLNNAGTLRIGGDNALGVLNGASASFLAGSTFAVDFTGTMADQLVLTGAANIAAGSILSVNRPTGAVWRAGDRAVFLTAAGGLTGRFTLQNNAPLSAFLGLRDGYTANSAYLEIFQTRDFTAAALTANQSGAAAGLQSLGSGSVLFNAIANMPNDAAAQVAFDAVSGELHPGVRGVVARDAYRIQQLTIRNASADEREAGLRAWGEVWSTSGRVNGDGNTARLDTDTLGFFSGADTHVGHGWRLGAALGYDQGDVDSRRGEGHADITRRSVLAYFDGQLNGWGLKGGLGYTDVGIETRRRAVFTSPVINLNETLAADYDGSITHAYLDASYAIAFGDSQVAPFVNLTRVSADTDAFAETGGLAALNVDKASADLTFTTLGVRAGGATLAGATLTGSAGWRHASGDRDAVGVHSLAGGSDFQVRGVEIARSAAVIDLDAQWRPRANLGVGAGVTYTGASGQSDYGARLSLRYSF